MSKNYKERPFEFLRRKKAPSEGELFDGKIVKNWYEARAFVMEKLKDITIKPGEDAHFHVIIMDDDDLMLSVVRQVALLAHFPNYDEEHPNETKRNRSVITVVSQKEDILNLLMQEENLCNLPKYCKYSFRGDIKNKDSFIDVELEIVDHWIDEVDGYKEIKIGKHTEKRFFFKKQDVICFYNGKTEEELYAIDTRKAQYTERIYSLGSEIDNLPYEDIHNVKRYALALDVFQFTKLKELTGQLVKPEYWEKEENQATVLTTLSNIFCSDCFMIRYNSIKPLWINGKMTEKQAWEKYYDVLSKSEHARWVVEKLILGYRPLNLQERLMDESLFVNNERRKQFRKDLKSNWKSPSHIDLCSFSDLRRIDPDSMKYDSFLMLGIPEILRKVGEPGKDGKSKKSNKTCK